MSRIETSWRFVNVERLKQLVGLLSTTSGVYELRITVDKQGPQIHFKHDEGLDVKALEFPDEPALWRNRVMELELRPYSCRSLREAIVFGWEVFRERQRWATHLCVWDRNGFYRELFNNAAWIDIPAYFDDVYGMGVVPLGGSSGEAVLPQGRVVMCGGRRFQGVVDDADFGLILERGK